LLPAALFVIICAVFLYFERSFSPTFQQCTSGQENSAQTSAAEKQPSFFGTTVDTYVRCTGLFFENNSEAVTALATLIIAIFTFTLWRATSTQARLTREALIADKRAFVFAESFSPLWEPGQVAGYFSARFVPLWKNSGDTPTRKLRIYTGCELRNSPLPANFDFTVTSVAPGGGLLGPKVSATGGVAPFPPAAAITASDLHDIQNGTKFLYRGWAKYFDGFPGTPERVTRFCWAMEPMGNAFQIDPNVEPFSNNPGAFGFRNRHMPFGNCADDECTQ